MMRHSSIAVGLGWLALCAAVAAPAAAQARPLYMESVLYAATEAPLFLAAADSGDLVPPTPRPSTIEEPPAAATPAPAMKQPSIALPLVSSAGGGAALGLTGGVLAAVLHEDQGSEDWEEIGLIVAGFYVGEVIGVAAGAHVGNGAKGSFGKDLVVSFLSSLVAVGAAAYGGTAGAIIGAGAQIYFTVQTERGVARRKLAEGAP